MYLITICTYILCCDQYRCLKLTFLRSTTCDDVSLATDFYGYEYTNLTEILNQVDNYDLLLDFNHICGQLTGYFICNYVFIPCDLFTGAPRPICSDSCYYYCTECSDTYHTLLRVIPQAYPYIMDDCDNTLSHLQTGYDFPCSSSSLENNCLDLLRKFSVLTLH